MHNNIPGYKVKQTVYVGKTYSILFAMNQITKIHHYIKIINSAYPDVKEISQLQHEMELIKDIDNESIIRIDDFIEFHNTFALVMEAVPSGCSLEAKLQNGPLSIEDFFEIAINITQGLTVLHQHNIIHKDIKPGNIVVSDDSTKAKIIDFGISVKLNSESPELQYDSLLRGSLPYISPEQTGQINRPVDYRSDFYSLGCTFYEMLAGQTPFKADNKRDWVKYHTRQTPCALTKMSHHIPKVLSDIVEILLDKNPENRYQSSYALQKDLIKCRSQYAESRFIWSFALSKQNISDKFLLSTKLIGRCKELEKMCCYLNGGISGEVNLTQVIGYSGIGKTAFVNEIRSNVMQNNSFFIKGKFQQYYSGVPYQALMDAFGQLVAKVLANNDKDFERWKAAISEALGENAMVLVELIPNLKKMLGSVQPVIQLGPRETLNRLILTVLKFIRVFAHQNYPLTIFIDDLQWADPASLTLIKKIVLNTELEAVNVIISYRSNEVDQSHVLSSVLEEIKLVKPINNITLKNLSSEHVNQIVAETLHMSIQDSSALADVVFQKTVGNPFFTKRLLQTLCRDGKFRFNYDLECWEYDLDEIKAIKITDNVAEFLINRIELLPKSTQDILSSAGLIGMQFSFNLLMKTNEQTVTELIKAIDEAVMNNIIEPISDNYNLLNSAIYCKSESKIMFKFVHDRLQHAVYKMIPEEKQSKIHLALGRLLIKNRQKYHANNMVVANHMNSALHLIKDDDEFFRVAKNNVSAAKYAIKASSHDIAYRFLDTLQKQIDEMYWEKHYSFIWDMYYQYIKCAYHLGKYSLAHRLIATCLDHSKTHIEKAEILKLKCVMNVALSNYDEALSAGLNALSLFGIKINKVPSKFTIVSHLLKTKIVLNKNNIEQMNEFPKMEDKENIMILDLIGELLAPAYLCDETNETLLPVLILKGVNLSLEHGFTKESCYLFEAFAFMQSAVFNNYQLAYHAGRLGCMAAEQLNSIDFMCRTYFVYTLFVMPWNCPYEEMIAGFLKSIKYGVISGDHQYLSYSAMHISLYDPHMNFKERVDLSNKHLAVLDKAEHYDLKLQGNLVKNFWRNLCGELECNSDLTSRDFNEAVYLKRVQDLNVVASLAQYYVLKLCLCYYHNEYDKAYRLIKKADEHYQAISGMAMVIEYSLFCFLTLYKVYDQASWLEKWTIKRRMKKEYGRVKKWSRYHHENFEHIKFTMEAIFAQISGKQNKALAKYHAASVAAKNIHHLRHDALICELVGHFLSECKWRASDEAESRFIEASVINSRLSCVVKCRQLNRYVCTSGAAQIVSSNETTVYDFKISRS